MAVLSSVGLHAGLAATILLAPLLSDRDRRPLEFVAVTIVPIQALGVPQPAPTPPRIEPKPAAPEPAPPEEAEKPAKPEPEPVFVDKPAKTARTTEPREKGRTATPEPGPEAAPRQRQGSPEGSPTGTSAFGATAVTGLDNPDFVYGYYIDQMVSLIGANWVRPPVGKGVEAVLHFRIGRKGEISELEIVTSSGHSSFDLAGLRAVRQADPLPALPNSFRGDSLGVNLVLR